MKFLRYISSIHSIASLCCCCCCLCNAASRRRRSIFVSHLCFPHHLKSLYPSAFFSTLPYHYLHVCVQTFCTFCGKHIWSAQVSVCVCRNYAQIFYNLSNGKVNKKSRRSCNSLSEIYYEVCVMHIHANISASMCVCECIEEGGREVHLIRPACYVYVRMQSYKCKMLL